MRTNEEQARLVLARRDAHIAAVFKRRKMLRTVVEYGSLAACLLLIVCAVFASGVLGSGENAIFGDNRSYSEQSPADGKVNNESSSASKKNDTESDCDTDSNLKADQDSQRKGNDTVSSDGQTDAVPDGGSSSDNNSNDTNRFGENADNKPSQGGTAMGMTVKVRKTVFAICAFAAVLCAVCAIVIAVKNRKMRRSIGVR